MRNFFKSLKTISHEPRILKETWSKEVHFPENYWRTELCVFFLLKDDHTDLPRALQFNFCPLFWFSNLLLLISPIWVPIYWFVSLFGFLGEKLIVENFKEFESWKKARKREINLKEREEHLAKVRSVKFDPNFPDYAKLDIGEAWIIGVLHAPSRSTNLS